ncbi:hypothetical protein BU16DRAFT_615137 [Lophium mytilinum]|uniref:Fungal N-terminal domain-containing protein n=1 Tax=Lophium mytilinum TaxID=390894 RepID=A0A6A6R4V2_9PEZI|nr:hypothetical protein BU16DRAFT_615137 [Lophium mytilinum]
MADPISIIGLVIGIGTTGCQISIALFDMASTVRHAAQDMKDLATELVNLSYIFIQLGDLLKDHRHLCTPEFFLSASSIVERFKEVEKELNKTTRKGKKMKRVKWLLRSPKIKGLLQKLEAIKTSTTLVLATINLTKEQASRKYNTIKNPNPVPKADIKSLRLDRDPKSPLPKYSAPINRFRKVVEGIVQASRFAIEKSQMQVEGNPNETKKYYDSRIQRWCAPPNDTATWLYRLVFCSDPAMSYQTLPKPYAGGSIIDYGGTGTSTSESDYESAEDEAHLVRFENQINAPGCIQWEPPSVVVDRLLRMWTTLDDVQIFESRVDSIDNKDNHQTQSRPGILKGQQKPPKPRDLKPHASDASDYSGGELSSAPGSDSCDGSEGPIDSKVPKATATTPWPDPSTMLFDSSPQNASQNDPQRTDSNPFFPGFDTGVNRNLYYPGYSRGQYTGNGVFAQNPYSVSPVPGAATAPPIHTSSRTPHPQVLPLSQMLGEYQSSEFSKSSNVPAETRTTTMSEASRAAPKSANEARMSRVIDLLLEQLVGGDKDDNDQSVAHVPLNETYLRECVRDLYRNEKNQDLTAQSRESDRDTAAAEQRTIDNACHEARREVEERAIERAKEAKAAADKELAQVTAAAKAAKRAKKALEEEIAKREQQKFEAKAAEERQKLNEQFAHLTKVIENQSVTQQGAHTDFHSSTSRQMALQPLRKTRIADGTRHVEVIEFAKNHLSPSNTTQIAPISIFQDDFPSLDYFSHRNADFGTSRNSRNGAYTPKSPSDTRGNEVSRSSPKPILFPSRIGSTSQAVSELQTSLTTCGLTASFEINSECDKTLIASSNQGEDPLWGTVFWEPPQFGHNSELLQTLKSYGWRPHYRRVSDVGQTYFLGHEPVHMFFFTPRYRPQLEPTKSSGPDSQSSTEYLIIGRELVEEYALQELGFDFKSTDSGGYALDCRLTPNDIDALIERSFTIRETNFRRHYRQLAWASEDLTQSRAEPTRSLNTGEMFWAERDIPRAQAITIRTSEEDSTPSKSSFDLLSSPSPAPSVYTIPSSAGLPSSLASDAGTLEDLIDLSGF